MTVLCMDAKGLNVVFLREDADLYEQIIRQQQLESATRPELLRHLRTLYLEPAREQAFDRFLRSLEFSKIKDILSAFDVCGGDAICEIGGGPGFLSWALACSGYRNVHLVEPNSNYNTGTGYLKTLNVDGLRIFSDLAEWYQAEVLYDVVITRNCIHHFKNITQGAAGIRQKLRQNGLWFAFREAFADTSGELYQRLKEHPYCQPFGLYEWYYPSWHYVEAIEMAGFALEAVVPAQYAANALGCYVERMEDPNVAAFTAHIDGMLRNRRPALVASYWKEVFANRYAGAGRRLFSRPQAMIFRVAPIV